MEKKGLIICSLAIVFFVFFPVGLWAQDEPPAGQLFESFGFLMKAKAFVDKGEEFANQKQFLLAITCYDKAIGLLDKAVNCLKKGNMPTQKKEELSGQLEEARYLIGEMKKAAAATMLLEQMVKELRQENAKPKVPDPPGN